MRKIFTLLLTMLIALAASAGPARRGWVWLQTKDGATVKAQLVGDEFCHYAVAENGEKLVADADGHYVTVSEDVLSKRKATVRRLARQRKAAKSSKYQLTAFPTTGEQRGLIILAEFADNSFTYSQEHFSRMMNEKGYSEDGHIGSAHDYFASQSMGRFLPKFDVVGPVKLSHNIAYYGTDDITTYDKNIDRMITDACKLAKSTYDIDFSLYDGDEDGEVDMVYVIYAGYGQNAGAPATTIWPRMFYLSQADANITIDGKTIETYACSPELDGNSGTVSCGIGQFCHEFGHVLGLADHYNTSSGTDYQFGSYDIMDYGEYNNEGRTPPAYNAFERMTLGWMTPDTLADEPMDNLTLEHIATSNKAYLIGSRYNADEFWLLENRQQTEWDEHLPANGLMITHVDYDSEEWFYNSVNDEEDHRHFQLVAADNEWAYDVVSGKNSEKGDLWPCLTQQNVSLTDNSTPAMKAFTGELTDRWITDIERSGDLVRFNYRANHLKSPKNLRVEQMTNDAFTAAWDDVEGATNYTVYLTRMQPESELKQAYRQGETQIGLEGQGGTTELPLLNLSSYDGIYTVAVTVASATGKTPVLTVESNGQTGKNRLTSIARTYIYIFKGGITTTDITISTNNDVAYVDSIVVMRGDQSALFASAKAITVSGEPALASGDEVDDPLVATDQAKTENVSATNYTFTNLDLLEDYAFSVQAFGEKQPSPVSEELLINLNPTSVKGASVIPNSQRATFFYDLSGRRASGGKGVRIVIDNNNTYKTIGK